MLEFSCVACFETCVGYMCFFVAYMFLLIVLTAFLRKQHIAILDNLKDGGGEIKSHSSTPVGMLNIDTNGTKHIHNGNSHIQISQRNTDHSFFTNL